MNHVIDGFLKAAGVKRLGRLLASAVKRETPELVDAVGRAAQKVTRRGRRLGETLGEPIAMITGRHSVFHGTKGGRTQSILESGLRPREHGTRIWASRSAEVAGSHGSEVVQAHVKDWGDGEVRRMNPYVRAVGRQAKRMHERLGGKSVRERMTRALHDSDRSSMAFNRVSPRFIEGSKDFQPMTGREVVDHAKAHPGRVRAGLRRLTEKP